MALRSVWFLQFIRTPLTYKIQIYLIKVKSSYSFLSDSIMMIRPNAKMNFNDIILEILAFSFRWTGQWILLGVVGIERSYRINGHPVLCFQETPSSTEGTWACSSSLSGLFEGNPPLLQSFRNRTSPEKNIRCTGSPITFSGA